MSNESLDHLPTPEELAKIYMSQEANNPCSLYYKRKLVRPKFPIWRLLLFFIVIPALCVPIYFGVNSIMQNKLASVLIAVAFLIICTLIFAKHILIALVLAYQSVAPAKLRERCRFEPSCSQYMIMSVKKYGFWRGFKKGLARWHRCKPPNGGYDLP